MISFWKETKLARLGLWLSMLVASVVCIAHQQPLLLTVLDRLRDRPPRNEPW